MVPNVGNTGLQTALIAGFPNEQVDVLMTMMSAMMDAKLEARSARFDQRRQQSNPIPTVETLTHTQSATHPVTQPTPDVER